MLTPLGSACRQTHFEPCNGKKITATAQPKNGTPARFNERENHADKRKASIKNAFLSTHAWTSPFSFDELRLNT